MNNEDIISLEVISKIFFDVSPEKKGAPLQHCGERPSQKLLFD
jgi:hypothetical protein